MPPLNNLLQLIFALLICSLATIKQKRSLAFSKAGVRRLASCLQRKPSCRDSNLWQCEKRNNTQTSVPALTSSFNLKCVGKTVLLFLCVIQSSTQTPGRTGLSTPEGRSADYYILPPSNQSQVNVLRGGETTKRLSGTQKFTPPRKFVACGPPTTSRKPTTPKKLHASKKPVFHPVCPQGVPYLLSKRLQLPRKNTGPSVTTKFCPKQKPARDVWHLLLVFYCRQILFASTQAILSSKIFALAPEIPVSGNSKKMGWDLSQTNSFLFSILVSISKKISNRKNSSSSTTNFFSYSRRGFPRSRAAPLRALSQEDHGWPFAKCTSIFKPPSQDQSQSILAPQKILCFRDQKIWRNKNFSCTTKFFKDYVVMNCVCPSLAEDMFSREKENPRYYFVLQELARGNFPPLQISQSEKFSIHFTVLGNSAPLPSSTITVPPRPQRRLYHSSEAEKGPPRPLNLQTFNTTQIFYS
jgi:hypothetical protein